MSKIILFHAFFSTVIVLFYSSSVYSLLLFLCCKNKTKIHLVYKTLHQQLSFFGVLISSLLTSRHVTCSLSSMMWVLALFVSTLPAAPACVTCFSCRFVFAFQRTTPGLGSRANTSMSLTHNSKVRPSFSLCDCVCVCVVACWL